MQVSSGSGYPSRWGRAGLSRSERVVRTHLASRKPSDCRSIMRRRGSPGRQDAVASSRLCRPGGIERSREAGQLGHRLTGFLGGLVPLGTSPCAHDGQPNWAGREGVCGLHTCPVGVSLVRTTRRRGGSLAGVDGGLSGWGRPAYGQAGAVLPKRSLTCE